MDTSFLFVVLFVVYALSMSALLAGFLADDWACSCWYEKGFFGFFVVLAFGTVPAILFIAAVVYLMSFPYKLGKYIKNLL